jgi:hypothetical protein
LTLISRLCTHLLRSFTKVNFGKTTNLLGRIFIKRVLQTTQSCLFDSNARSPESESSASISGSPFNRRRKVAPILLFAIFSLAARYANEPPSLSENAMWDAGDQYLDCANTLLDKSYSSSRSSTCQALLLLGYREIGIGAMAQAWTYIGMAIRMAQDLGLHRNAEGWSRPGIGGRLFSEWELNERRRIWYFCVIMDKYVSSYIGTPHGVRSYFPF